MTIIHTLPLCQPPVHIVQRQAASKPPQVMTCRAAPSLAVRRERPPETLQDYAGAATLFVPISATVLLHCCQDPESMNDDVKPIYAVSLFVYTLIVTFAIATFARL